MEPLTLIYVMLTAAGLVGADAYMNSTTLFLQANVAPAFVTRGFSSDVVEGILLRELNEITNTKSLVMSPSIVSSNSSTISGAVAEVAGISTALKSIKSATGLDNPVLLVNLVVDDVKGKELRRILVAGQDSDGKEFKFSANLENSRPFDEILGDVAVQAMQVISPYVTALYTFDEEQRAGEMPVMTEKMVMERLGEASINRYDPDRALYENLFGLIHILKKDLENAEIWFQKARISDPELTPVSVNLAFIEAAKGHYREAIEILLPIADDSFVFSEDAKVIRYVALGLIAHCYSQLDDFGTSERYFRKATELNPEGISVYYYWAMSYQRQGLTRQSQDYRDISEKNSIWLRDFPELAALYAWLPDQAGQPLVPRARIKIITHRY